MNTEAKNFAEDQCAQSSGDIPSAQLKFVGSDKRMTRQEFSETYRQWIAEQNCVFETQGLWCDGLQAL